MIGILYYLYFLILGFLYSKYIFNKNIYFHIWIGGIFGNILLMVGIIIPSLIFGFTIISHIILLILSTIPLIILIKKKGVPKIKDNIKKVEMTSKIFIFLIIPIFLLIAILLTNHILVPVENGVASGQSTYGDLNMHLGFITSISEQEVFPPNYAFLSGVKLNYPFLVNSLSSSLYSLGTSLRMSVLIPSYFLCLFLIMGFYFLAYKISDSRRVSVLSTVLFFLGGGLGFIYFLDGAISDTTVFTRIFTDYYHTPTNFNEMNIRWANPICDMIIPQRSTMAGWFMIMPCLWFLIDGCKTNNKKSFIILGLLASCMPMIHTHSFLSLGVISVGMFIYYFFKSKEKKKVFKNWFIYGLIVLLLAFPQLFYWTFSQTVGNNNFLKFHFNWVNQTDPYVWFYIKNWGLVAIFIIPAYLYANKDNRKLILSSLLLFILAELIVFQPNDYDNNKLFFIVYMIFLINCCNWYIHIFDKLKKVPGRYFVLVLIIILSTLSGILTIGREYVSGGIYQTFSNNMIKMSEYVKDNTEKDAIFLTSTTHINPIVSLAGRNVYVGSSFYVFYHGFGEEFYNRELEIKKIYNSDYDKLISFCKEHNITYLYIGASERSDLTINWDTINKLNKVISYGDEELYKIT
jgi:hypothetical protein